MYIYIYIVHINFKCAVPMVILSSVMILLVDDDSAALISSNPTPVCYTQLCYAIDGFFMDD